MMRPFLATCTIGLRPTSAQVGHCPLLQSANGAVLYGNVPFSCVSTFPTTSLHSPERSTLPARRARAP